MNEEEPTDWSRIVKLKCFMERHAAALFDTAPPKPVLSHPSDFFVLQDVRAIAPLPEFPSRNPNARQPVLHLPFRGVKRGDGSLVPIGQFSGLFWTLPGYSSKMFQGLSPEVALAKFNTWIRHIINTDLSVSFERLENIILSVERLMENEVETEFRQSPENTALVKRSIEVIKRLTMKTDAPDSGQFASEDELKQAIADLVAKRLVNSQEKFDVIGPFAVRINGQVRRFIGGESFRVHHAQIVLEKNQEVTIKFAMVPAEASNIMAMKIDHQQEVEIFGAKISARIESMMAEEMKKPEWQSARNAIIDRELAERYEGSVVPFGAFS